MEQIRQFTRRFISYKSPLYRTASEVLSQSTILFREGLSTLRQLNQLRRQSSGEPVPVQFKSLSHPIYLRPGTSDCEAALDNAVRHEYGQFQSDGTEQPAVLVDAGAYIGDVSAYFLSRFPTLKAYALEPNPDSLPMARLNLQPYGDRVELLAMALSDQEGTVSFGGQEMGARIGGGGDLTIETTTLPKLLEKIPQGRIDILKLDVEGAEMDILCGDVAAWLPAVGRVIIETHGVEIEKKLLSVMADHGWHARRFRNLYYCAPGTT